RGVLLRPRRVPPAPIFHSNKKKKKKQLGFCSAPADVPAIVRARTSGVKNALMSKRMTNMHQDTTFDATENKRVMFIAKF
ncbi:hypothetical protein M0O54_19965, partial [Acinetobacter lactucae]